jgi:hypothetical protein
MPDLRPDIYGDERNALLLASGKLWSQCIK